ncbi:MAG TPA: M48 family metallopeptidase [Prolixibacteraceae bacterium]|jgi:Zn-dependent protease with chaperone function
MDSKLDYQVNPRENVYFYMRLLISLGLYYLIVQLVLWSLKETGPQVASIYMIYAYAVMILIFLFFRFGLLIGHLKGNGIKLGKNQFADIYQVAVKQAELLGLSKVPSIYILQSGGVLNAFAARFLGRNYIVLYSEIVETAYDQDKSILEFIIGHEMGHIKRQHMLKNLILMPSYIIPFLAAAYSRACEYTCDAIGHALSPAGAKGGLLVLASGKTIYKKVNLNEFLRQDVSEDGFWKWFAEKVASHPNLTRRLNALGEAKVSPTARSRASLMEEMAIAPVVVEVKEDDHNPYMPK